MFTFMLDIPTDYCETFLQSGWEPINTLSNLAFVIAGLAAIHIANKQRDNILLLPAILLIGVGFASSYWHMTQSTYADIADTVSILLFASVIGILFLQRLFRSYGKTTLACVLLMSLALFAEQQPILNGSLPYLVLLAAFLLAGLVYKKRFSPVRWQYLFAALMFAFAILFRTIDLHTCDHTHAGTHFLWHILVALFSYQLIFLTSRLKSRTTQH